MFVVPAFVFAIAAGYVIYERSSSVSSPFPAPTAGGLLSLPVANFRLKEGSGQGLVQAYCTACHSLAPIVRHDGFAAQTWADEVQKMRQQYGCPLDDATTASITKYLQEHYAAAPPPAHGTAPVASAAQ